MKVKDLKEYLESNCISDEAEIFIDTGDINIPLVQSVYGAGEVVVLAVFEGEEG